MQQHRKPINLLAVTVLVWAGSWAAPGLAQLRISATAVSGGRFGVGRLSVDLPMHQQPRPLGVEALCLDEKDGRALYPAIGKPPFGGLFADLVGARQRLAIYFLFRGDAPLELTLRGRSAYAITVTPRADPAAHRRLLDDWWRQYTAPPGLLQTKPDYPPLVENYLTSTLARRLNLRLPQEKQTPQWQDELEKEMGLTLGTELIRVGMQQQRILGLTNLDQVADQPLPRPAPPAAMEVPPPPEGVQVEPIALRVPQECFYVHFATFGNFLWFQDTLAQWGGDLQNLLAARGLDYGLSTGMESQLVLKMTELSRLFGGTVIAEVAIIGTDTFFREGASFGVLLHARNNTILIADIIRQRAARLAAGGVNEEKVTIDGHAVSLLASPDGSVRSYYVADGDYHFVTTSKTLAGRFLETASGAGALGGSKAFRHARTIMPLKRQDTVFVYLSNAFFRNFTGPHYRVEMARRLQANADIDLVRLARLAAKAEGKPAETIEQLIAAESLPPGFGPRPDGSRTVLAGGEVYDSLRGRSGTFLPVPETPVDRVTLSEASNYRKFAESFHEQWGGRIDPTMIGIKRHALPENRERVVIDAHLSPFAPHHFEFLSQWAGPPTKRQLSPVEGDLAAFELVLKDQFLFGGLQDSRPPLEIIGGLVLPVGRPRDILVGYLGTSGQIGLLSFLDVQILQQPDEHGYSNNLLGLYRRQFDDFTVFSLHAEVLAAVTPKLRFQQSQRPAQLRLRVDDPSEVRMTAFLNNFGYLRTRETSLGNLRLINGLRQQLHVAPKDCRQVAEKLMGAKLVCPLGGKYVFKETTDGTGRWTSTALTSGGGIPLLGTQVPPGYQAPPLNWFRGLELEASMTEKILSAHAELVMQLPEKE